jgi:hypothetical protein
MCRIDLSPPLLHIAGVRLMSPAHRIGTRFLEVLQPRDAHLIQIVIDDTQNVSFRLTFSSQPHNERNYGLL